MSKDLTALFSRLKDHVPAEDWQEFEEFLESLPTPKGYYSQGIQKPINEALSRNENLRAGGASAEGGRLGTAGRERPARRNPTRRK